MRWTEAEILPAECDGCREEDCYNCDCAGARWRLSREDEERLRDILRQRKAERWQKRRVLTEKG